MPLFLICRAPSLPRPTPARTRNVRLSSRLLHLSETLPFLIQYLRPHQAPTTKLLFSQLYL